MVSLAVKRGDEAMLVGKYNHTLDAKNRMFIPAKHREILGDKFMIVKNVDHCLSVYSMEAWEKYAAKINEQPKIKARKMLRQIYSNAASVEPDSQGRVPISEEMKKYAGIEKNVVILGCGEYAEIWSEEAYLIEEADDNDDSLLEMMLEAGL